VDLHVGLRGKIVGLIAASLVTLALMLLAATVWFSHRTLGVELARRALAHAHATAVDLAAPVAAGDREALGRALARRVAAGEGLLYVVVRDAYGQRLAEAHGREVDGLALPAPGGPEVTKGRGHLPVGKQRVTDTTVEVWLPAPEGQGGPGTLVGSVQVGISLDDANVAMDDVLNRLGLVALITTLACLGLAWLVARRLVTPLRQLAGAVAGVAAGDLGRPLEVGGHDEIGALGRAFQRMREALAASRAEVQVAAKEVAREARAIRVAVERQAAMGLDQASAVQQTSQAVGDMARASEQAAAGADRVTATSDRTDDFTAQGLQVVSEAVEGMARLDEQVEAIARAVAALTAGSARIGEITQTAIDVAEQSNVLALNAAIEASKAGAAGQGFSVVALEMRRLAEQSRAAAAQVRGVLGETARSTRQAVSAAEEGRRRAGQATEQARRAGAVIEGLGEVVRESVRAGRDIAGQTRQQSDGVRQMVEALNEVEAASASALEGTLVIERGARRLEALAARLAVQVGNSEESRG
jgi:methyl-accepting chemotaxis protein